MKMYFLVIFYGFFFKVYIYFCFLNRDINIDLLMIYVDDICVYKVENKN